MQIQKNLVKFLIGASCYLALSAPIHADDWLVRARVIAVDPDSSSSAVPGVANSGVEPDLAPTLEVDFTRFLSQQWGLELILATTKHDIEGTGALAGADVGEVKVLPPTLTLQYHFMPTNSVRPYAGIGINYTKFYGEKLGSALIANGATGIDYDDSFGLAAQAGMDIDINKNWFFNIDVKYINIDTTATIQGGALAGDVDVDINPWVYGIGIGTRF